MKYIFLILSLSAGPASAIQISGFKNDLFQHRRVIDSRSNGNFVIFDYNEARDVNGQDEIPVDKALTERVTLLDTGFERSTRISGVDTNVAGNIKGAKFAVIFIHGQNGNKNLGFNDWTFGGNFNRLKNIVIRSDGFYLSPTARLNKRGAKNIGTMIQSLKAKNSGLKVVLSCASAGGLICSDLSRSEAHSSLIDGVIYLGSAVVPNLVSQSQFYLKKTPIIIAHGSSDPIADWSYFLQVFKTLDSDQHPVKLFIYKSGIHGTPIRMFDWAEGLNWIL